MKYGFGEMIRDILAVWNIETNILMSSYKFYLKTGNREVQVQKRKI